MADLSPLPTGRKRTRMVSLVCGAITYGVWKEGRRKEEASAPEISVRAIVNGLTPELERMIVVSFQAPQVRENFGTEGGATISGATIDQRESEISSSCPRGPRSQMRAVLSYAEVATYRPSGLKVP